jgi:hypothetical protein
VASEKPGSVPALAASLELLGIELKADPAYFTANGKEVQAAATLNLQAVQRRQTFQWLSEFDGN